MDSVLLFRRVKWEICDNWIHVTINFNLHELASIQQDFSTSWLDANELISFLFNSDEGIDRHVKEPDLLVLRKFIVSP